MFGSHADSQPTGGKFDGALGMMAGLRSCAYCMTSTSSLM
jgi:hypothetical protein